MKFMNKYCAVLAFALAGSLVYAEDSVDPFGGNNQLTIEEKSSEQEVAKEVEKNESVEFKVSEAKSKLADFIGKSARAIANSLYIKLTSSGGGVLGRFSKNTELTIIGVDGNFFKAKYGEKEILIHSKWVAIKGMKAETPDVGYIIKDISAKDEDGKVITELGVNSIVQITGDAGSNWKISLNGKDAYVDKNYVELETESLNYDDIKITAEDKKSSENSDSKSEPKISNNVDNTKKTEADTKAKAASEEKKKAAEDTKKKNEAKETEKYALQSKSKIKVKEYYHDSIGKKYDDGHHYTHVQGMCSDGKYFYVALMTSTNGDKTYCSQITKLLKIDIAKKKVVASKNLGKIGHSNSLCYNPKTKKVLLAPCTSKKSYIYEVGTDLKGLKAQKLYDKNGKPYNNNCFASFGYDPLKDQYVVKLSNKKIGFFNSKFKLVKSVSCSNLKIQDSYTGQALSTDGHYIISCCNDFSKMPRPSFILVYDMNGKQLEKYTLNKVLGDHSELEEVCPVGKDVYLLVNVSGFKIFKINMYK